MEWVNSLSSNCTYVGPEQFGMDKPPDLHMETVSHLSAENLKLASFGEFHCNWQNVEIQHSLRIKKTQHEQARTLLRRTFWFSQNHEKGENLN